ncbi:MAG: YidC/Oxa1 family membrane protein insertase [Candidatus Pacebacteria bacterium]|nr:YidC/Oxa1 family membrane protein insertase [Candidatus Paceibacterota bacterium]MBP9716158.1 YidC/Oxa1 family membrane protein insertase [Candidatus Paceibacterota bacterium]
MLVFLIDKVTFGDIGFAIIILTILVKLILFPLAKKSIQSQIYMKKLEPELKKLKTDYPNKEEQAKKQFELYKKYGVNPFSGCLVVLLQLPVIFALYYVFINFKIDSSIIYSFINVPVVMNTNFLGLFDLSLNHSIFLALLAGISQYFQAYLATPKKTIKDVEVVSDNTKKTFQEELASSMQLNIRYVLPVFVAFIAYTFSAGVALYWIVSNIFTIGQEWYVRDQIAKKENNF